MKVRTWFASCRYHIRVYPSTQHLASRVRFGEIGRGGTGKGDDGRRAVDRAVNCAKA